MPPEIAVFCRNLLFLECDDILFWVSTKAISLSSAGQRRENKTSGSWDEIRTRRDCSSITIIGTIG